MTNVTFYLVSGISSVVRRTKRAGGIGLSLTLLLQQGAKTQTLEYVKEFQI